MNMTLYWLGCAVLLTLIVICSAQIRKRLQREEKKVNPDPLPEVDVKLDWFSYNNNCWHCSWLEGNVPMYGLVHNLTDSKIAPQVIRVRKYPPSQMEEGLRHLEAIHLDLPDDEVILTKKGPLGWLCKYPNKLGIAVTGVVHHTVHLLGKHLRPGKILKVKRLGEKDFEPTDLEPAPEQ
jgi:hypothetical protein